MPKPLMILVAGPCRSGTNDDPTLIARNVAAMTEVSLQVFRAGHLPVERGALARQRGKAVYHALDELPAAADTL